MTLRYHVVVEGTPRSGKNSQDIMVNPRTGRRFTKKSKAASAWLSDAIAAIATTYPYRRPIDGPCHIHVAVWHKLPAHCWDGDNVQNLAWDAAKKAKLVTDDNASVIVSWSGEAHVDKARPRVEITITAKPAAKAA